MKKNGFIATSLIYSFFLVFVAIIASLMSNYIANKTILDRYNQQVTEDLNKKTHSIILQVSNGEIDDNGAITMTNLVQNGNFTDGLNFWSLTNTSALTSSSYLGINALRKYHYYPTATANQVINFTGNNSKYYLAVDVYHPQYSNNDFYVDIDDTKRIEINKNADNQWRKVFTDYTSNTTQSRTLKLGEISRNLGNYYTYITNIMVINLSASFGYGLEPSKEWVSENVEWFDGTIDYLKRDNIEKNTETTFTIKSKSGYRFLSTNISCHNDAGIVVTPKEQQITSSNTIVKLTFKSITDDVMCTIKAT